MGRKRSYENVDVVTRRCHDALKRNDMPHRTDLNFLLQCSERHARKIYDEMRDRGMREPAKNPETSTLNPYAPWSNPDSAEVKELRRQLPTDPATPPSLLREWRRMSTNNSNRGANATSSDIIAHDASTSGPASTAVSPNTDDSTRDGLISQNSVRSGNESQTLLNQWGIVRVSEEEASSSTDQRLPPGQIPVGVAKNDPNPKRVVTAEFRNGQLWYRPHSFTYDWNRLEPTPQHEENWSGLTLISFADLPDHVLLSREITECSSNDASWAEKLRSFVFNKTGKPITRTWGVDSAHDMQKNSWISIRIEENIKCMDGEFSFLDARTRNLPEDVIFRTADQMFRLAIHLDNDIEFARQRLMQLTQDDVKFTRAERCQAASVLIEKIWKAQCSVENEMLAVRALSEAD